MGFEFHILYKKGINNKVADALSRKPGAEVLALILDTGTANLFDWIKSS